jgi:hypothetical protein
MLRGKKFWALVALLVLVFLYPFESTIVPPQRVLVVTEDWKPVQGALVRQNWQNYSMEADGHEEDLPTDENGRVFFPRRTARASLLWRIYRPIANIVTQGVHASFGVQTDTIPLGDVWVKPVGQNRVEAHPGEIVFRRR